MAQTVHYAASVGTAPSTMTLALDGALGQQCPPIPGPGPVKQVPQPVFVAPDTKQNGAIAKRMEFFVPYATPAAFKGSGLGLINETDWWRTGRPYGLPGTQAIFISGGPPGIPGVGQPFRIPSYMSGQVFPPGYEGPQTLSGLGADEPFPGVSEARRLARLQTIFLGVVALGAILGGGSLVAREIRKRRV